MSFLKREWGAVTFVATVLVGAIAVAISLIVAGAHAPPTPPLANCPSYTPYVGTATPSPGAATPSPTATPSATPFNPALANCPTPPLPPSSTPAPTPPPSPSGSASASASPATTATPSPGATPIP